MSSFRIPLVWQMYGHVDVEADTLDDAIEYALGPDCPLPEGEYPQRNDAECITLSEACMEDHVAVEIRSTETGMCFEEHVTCDEDGNLNHAERDLSRCKCRNCGEISLFGSFEDLDDAECSECGERGFDRCEEE